MKPRMNEDWLAVWLGLLFFALSLGPLFGADMLGWAVTTSVWTNLSTALAPASKAYSRLPGWLSLLATFAFLLAVLTAGAVALGLKPARFAKCFTAVFVVAYASWIAGSCAYIAATPDKRAAFHIGWSLNLTNQAGYVVALLAGVLVRQLFASSPGGPEEGDPPGGCIKKPNVILGGVFWVTAAGQRRAC